LEAENQAESDDTSAEEEAALNCDDQYEVDNDGNAY